MTAGAAEKATAIAVTLTTERRKGLGFYRFMIPLFENLLTEAF